MFTSNRLIQSDEFSFAKSSEKKEKFIWLKIIVVLFAVSLSSFLCTWLVLIAESWRTLERAFSHCMWRNRSTPSGKLVLPVWNERKSTSQSLACQKEHFTYFTFRFLYSILLLRLFVLFCYGTKIEKMLKHFRNVNQCNDFWNRRRVGSVETLVKGSAGLIPRRTRKLSRSIECQFIYANCWACDLLFVMTVISFRGERSDWDFLAFLTSQRGIYWLSQIIDREIYCLWWALPVGGDPGGVWTFFGVSYSLCFVSWS